MITMPAPSSEETVTTPDGVKLHVERFVPRGVPVGTLVFVHGFSSHLGYFRHLGRAFADAGFTATLFDCRGHGRSDGRRGYVKRFGDFIADLDLVVGGARASNTALPLVLGGHSHGALICLEYLLETGGHPARTTRPADVAALALAAPFLGLKLAVPLFKRALAAPLGLLWPTLALGNGIKPDDISRLPEAQAGFFADPLVHHVATSRWYNEVRATQARVMAAAPGLKTPTLMQLAGSDRLISNDAAREFARSAGPVVEVRVYDNLFHELFLEPERDAVIAELVRWTTTKLDV
jgi:alpha-beta hydrolase superfamily lysophospholipase